MFVTNVCVFVCISKEEKPARADFRSRMFHTHFLPPPPPPRLHSSKTILKWALLTLVFNSVPSRNPKPIYQETVWPESNSLSITNAVVSNLKTPCWPLLCTKGELGLVIVDYWIALAIPSQREKAGCVRLLNNILPSCFLSPYCLIINEKGPAPVHLYACCTYVHIHTLIQARCMSM